MVSTGGGLEASINATRCRYMKFMECAELLYGNRFPLNMKGAVYKSHVSQTILCRNEVWCLKESEMRNYQRTECSILTEICRAQLKEEDSWS